MNTHTLKVDLKAAFLATALTLPLAGCAPTPLLRVSSRIASFGQDLDPEMVGVNLVGMVGFDETHVGRMSRVSRGILYLAGAVEGTPEYQYRVAHINLRIIRGLPPLIKPGSHSFSTGAVVPSHIPELKAWDIVEIRQTGTYDVIKDFSTTGEGNAVLRVLCRKSAPDYEACANALPRIGEFRAWGPTGTPYLPTLKEYGFQFSTAYDETGKLLRPLPQ
jgi:hypothetical protein